MTLPRVTCGSNSSISSTVQLCFSRSAISAKRIALLREQVAVGHRVPDGDDLEAAGHQVLDDRPRGLALAGAGAHRADRDDRLRALDLRRVGPEQDVVRPGSLGDRAEGQDVLERDVAVREGDVVDLEVLDDLREVALEVVRNPLRVELAGQLGRIHAVEDARDLRADGEAHDVVGLVVPVVRVEVVEVTTTGTDDQDVFLLPLIRPPCLAASCCWLLDLKLT